MDPFQNLQRHVRYGVFDNYRQHEVPWSAPAPARNMNMFQDLVTMGHQEHADGSADYAAAQAFQGSVVPAFEMFRQDYQISSQEHGAIAYGKGEVAFQTSEPTFQMQSKPENAGSSNKRTDRSVGSSESEEIAYMRAMPGRATRAHSLQERERRQIVRRKMDQLESIVPGCQEIVGSQLDVLNHIINYVEKIQRYIEILTEQVHDKTNRLFNCNETSFMETAVANNGSSEGNAGSNVNNIALQTFHCQSNGNINVSDNIPHPACLERVPRQMQGFQDRY